VLGLVEASVIVMGEWIGGSGSGELHRFYADYQKKETDRWTDASGTGEGCTLGACDQARVIASVAGLTISLTVR
jgi:hypothetical protein